MKKKIIQIEQNRYNKCANSLFSSLSLSSVLPFLFASLHTHHKLVTHWLQTHYIVRKSTIQIFQRFFMQSGAVNPVSSGRWWHHNPRLLHLVHVLVVVVVGAYAGPGRPRGQRQRE